MRRLFLIGIAVCAIAATRMYAQIRTPYLVQTTHEDEWIQLSVDKVVYFEHDTVRLTIRRTDSNATALITPVLPIEGVTLKADGRRMFTAVLPEGVTPGAYAVNLRVLDRQGRRFWYKTDCIVTIEEHQNIARVDSFARIVPVMGGPEKRSAVALERGVIQNLEVQFDRDSIRQGMGPQFLIIRTTVIPRDGASSHVLERRVVTFRSHGDESKDRLAFLQYKSAYSKFAMLTQEETDHVRLPVDSLPDWALLIVQIEPDYSIKIGPTDRSNVITKYFRVRGPKYEIGFLIGIPKVLYDSHADDPIEYGNTSAMVRLFYVNEFTGNRFPVNAGVGTFGVNSPIDIGAGRGGVAFSVLLDLAELIRVLNLGFTNKVNIGLELTQLFSIERKRRFLIDTQVSLSL
ncbi:MAG TPA: hypothetical protein VK470_01060 [Bacteroidota bacterium]|nr:hypothetical protein [Bacteroidota bacterium]